MEEDGHHSVVLVCSICGFLFTVLSPLSFWVLWAVNWRPWRLYRYTAEYLYFFSIGLINILLFLLLVNPSPFSFVTQLDICKEMASICARTSTKHPVQFVDSFCLARRHFPYSSAARVGKFPYCSSGKEHNWFSYNNGGYCFAFVILLYNALVENTMAKFKYVICSLS